MKFKPAKTRSKSRKKSRNPGPTDYNTSDSIHKTRLRKSFTNKMNKTKKNSFFDLAIAKAKKEPGVGQYKVAEAWEKSAKFKSSFRSKGRR